MRISFENDQKNPPPPKEDLLLGFSQKQMTRRPTPPAVAENLISVTPESSFFLGTNS